MDYNFIKASEVKNKLSSNEACQIIDVRELGEFKQEHILDSKHAPLSTFEKHLPDLDAKHTLFVLCKSGKRACKAADQLHANGIHNFKVIEGGIDAWKQQGLPTQVTPTNIWSLERQVRFTAGLLVLSGLLIGKFFHPAGLLFSMAIGAGLMFSAISNTCGMGSVLNKMPWNR